MPDDDQKTFTQEQVNSFMAEEKRKWQEQIAQMEERLNTVESEREKLMEQAQHLSQTAEMTDEQREKLKQELDDMKQKGSTEKERYEQNELALKKQIKELETDRDNKVEELSNKYKDLIVKTQVQRAAEGGEDRPRAKDSEAVLALIKDKITFEEDQPLVTVLDGEETKNVPINDALQTLYEGKYSFMFDDKRKPGTGDNDPSGKGKDPNDPGETPEDVKTWVKSNRRDY